MRPFDSVTVGQYMLSLAKDKGYSLNITQVQKLLFILYGYFFSKYNEPILSESPKAWPYRPVFPRTRKHIDFGVTFPLGHDTFKAIVNDTELSEAVNRILDRFGSVSAGRLSAWSHKDGSAWERAVEEGGMGWNKPIKNDYIKEYFDEFTII